MGGAPEKVTLSYKGQEITPRLGTNELCDVELSLGGISVEQLGKTLANGGASMAAVRAIFRAVLIDALPDLSLVEAGRILGDVGADKAGKVIQSAFAQLKAGQTAATSATVLGECDPQGRLAFEVNRRRFVLAFHFNAMAELEPMFPGLGMAGIAAKLAGDGVSVSSLRGLFRAALIDHEELSLWEAGMVMDDIGIAIVGDAIGKAFIGAFPKVPPVPDDEGDQPEPNRKGRRAAKAATANPTKRKAKAGTGTRSRPRGQAPA